MAASSETSASSPDSQGHLNLGKNDNSIVNIKDQEPEKSQIALNRSDSARFSINRNNSSSTSRRRNTITKTSPSTNTHSFPPAPSPYTVSASFAKKSNTVTGASFANYSSPSSSYTTETTTPLASRGSDRLSFANFRDSWRFSSSASQPRRDPNNTSILQPHRKSASTIFPTTAEIGDTEPLLTAEATNGSGSTADTFSSSSVSGSLRSQRSPEQRSTELAKLSKIAFAEGTKRGDDSTPHKMHQTSSRLLRMTEDDRPFTRDFKDLFSTLMVSLPLSTHRLRFKSYHFTFTSEEAINNLGSLKFSQSNRMPDPKDASRIVTTTTTTTFSMAKEMARSVCQRFMDARFIEVADGKQVPVFPLKGCLWQLTPKGIHVLDRFCQRNGINQEHVLRLLHSPLNTMKLVILERDIKTDKVSGDKTTVEVIFRRFAGPQPNIKASVSVSDNDSLSEYSDGLTGVKMAEVRKIYDKVVKNSFTGKAAVDWLLDCCTTVERSETYEILANFVHYGLIESAFEDRVYIQQNPKATDFQPTKNAVYIFTERGKRVAGWIEGPPPAERNLNGEGSNAGGAVKGKLEKGPRDTRETNTTRLTAILNDPALRLLFREFLREIVCEENLSFYCDVIEFKKTVDGLDTKKPDVVRETLASAYGLYNAFLAPGSPCELNIDSTLRQDMASRMTMAVEKDEESMYANLREVANLFERARAQVFKLMAADSVPKFIRTARYMEVAGDILDDERQGTRQRAK